MTRWLGFGAGLLAGGLTFLGLRGVHPVFNTGESLMQAVYVCRFRGSQEVSRGQVIEYAPPARVVTQVQRVAPTARLDVPWLKRAAAVAGDKVCWTQDALSINDRFAGLLPLLEQYPLTRITGCVHLQPGEILPLGETAQSFDGRYSGVLQVQEISQLCAPLF